MIVDEISCLKRRTYIGITDKIKINAFLTTRNKIKKVSNVTTYKLSFKRLLLYLTNDV